MRLARLATPRAAVLAIFARAMARTPRRASEDRNRASRGRLLSLLDMAEKTWILGCGHEAPLTEAELAAVAVGRIQIPRRPRRCPVCEKMRDVAGGPRER